MKRKLIGTIVILVILFLTVCWPVITADSSGSYSGGSWSFDYGSNTKYGAYIGDVKWNQAKYIYIANVPWIKIDNKKYEIPNDFTLHEIGCEEFSSYYLAYQTYSMVTTIKTPEGDVIEVTHNVEILWFFYKSPVSGAGKVEINILYSVDDGLSHSLFVPFRVDFDILDSYDDCHYGYGTTGWALQTVESPQSTTNPVDPTWGMKIKQVEYFHESAWGGIKAWSTSETNYALRCHTNEYKGDPSSYLNGENTFRKDNVIWTTASTSGLSPMQFGPTVFVH